MKPDILPRVLRALHSTLNLKPIPSQASAHHFKVPEDELKAMEAEAADEIQIMNAPGPVSSACLAFLCVCDLDNDDLEHRTVKTFRR